MLSTTSNQAKIQQRLKFKPEEDYFLKYVMKNLEAFNDPFLWEQLTYFFNERFPYSHKTISQIKHHYQNCLQTNLQDGKFSKDEMIIFSLLREVYQKSLSEIAKDMKRTYQSVKNYYYRDYQPLDKRRQHFANDNEQMENEIMSYENDWEFYGINSNPF
jgi:hypothetical protein